MKLPRIILPDRRMPNTAIYKSITHKLHYKKVLSYPFKTTRKFSSTNQSYKSVPNQPMKFTRRFSINQSNLQECFHLTNQSDKNVLNQRIKKKTTSFCRVLKKKTTTQKRLSLTQPRICPSILSNKKNIARIC